MGEKQLKREIGLVGLLFIGLSSIIGTGWLFAPFYAAQMAGPAAILSWIIAAILSFINVLVLVELGCMLPLSGSIGRWIHLSHGGFCSYIVSLAGWFSFVTTTPAEVSGALEYINNFFPVLDRTINDEQVLTALGLGIAFLLMALFTWINCRGIQWLSRLNNSLMVWKLIVPFATPIILIVVSFHSGNFTEFGGFMPMGMHGVLSAISTGGVIFAYSGLRCVADMSGESRNPQRHVLLATGGALLICMVLYILLQIALIGVTNPADLVKGWAQLPTATASGPFAAIASSLGLVWLAFILYSDAIVSPGGTALVSCGLTSRLSYAMSENGYFPPIMQRLNIYQVPGWGLIINGVIGCLMLLPFPGWQQLVGVISSAGVIALAFASVALITMRQQLPDQLRPFTLPYAPLIANLSFIACTLMIYWTGWTTLWKVLLMLLFGIVVVLPIGNWTNPRSSQLNAISGAWMILYFVGLGLLSYLGTFGGISLFPQYVDQGVVAVFSLIIFAIATRSGLTPVQSSQLVKAALPD